MASHRSPISFNLTLPDRDLLERLHRETGQHRVRIISAALQRYANSGLYRKPRHYDSWQEAIEAEQPTNRESVLFIIVAPDGTVEAFGG